MKTNTYFKDVLGHSKVCEQLEKLAYGSHTPHAFIFCGPTGVGKRTTAIEFAKALLEQKTTDENVQAARLVERGQHADLHFLSREEGKKFIAVDEIRNLCNKLQLKPYYPGPSVAIIDDAHTMSIGACNAFLKTLEEPPGHAYIFLITSSPQQLLETILSRCQTVHFAQLNSKRVAKILLRLFPEESELCDTLASISPHSLELLEISGYLDERTSEPLDKKRLLKHLRDFENNYSRIFRKVEAILKESEPSIRAAKAVAVISDLCAEKSDVFLTCCVLRNRIRSKMLAASSDEEIKDSALLLQKLIDAEQLVAERTLNPQLKISSVFC